MTNEEFKWIAQAINNLMEDVTLIKDELGYLFKRERQREDRGGERLKAYGGNPHFSEVVTMVEQILAAQNKPMYAPAIYTEMVRRRMILISKNPPNYLSTILSRDRERTGSRLVKGMNGWYVKRTIKGTPDEDSPLLDRFKKQLDFEKGFHEGVNEIAEANRKRFEAYDKPNLERPPLDIEDD